MDGGSSATALPFGGLGLQPRFGRTRSRRHDEWSDLGTIARPSSLPPGVPHFSWAAFIFPWLWPAVYGMPALSAIAVGSVILGKMLAVLMPSVGLGFALLPLGVALAIGFTAHDHYWRANPKALSSEEFVLKQSPWIIVGVALSVLVLGTLLLVVSGTLGKGCI